MAARDDIETPTKRPRRWVQIILLIVLVLFSLFLLCIPGRQGLAPETDQPAQSP